MDAVDGILGATTQPRDTLRKVECVLLGHIDHVKARLEEIREETLQFVRAQEACVQKEEEETVPTSAQDFVPHM